MLNKNVVDDIVCFFCCFFFFCFFFCFFVLVFSEKIRHGISRELLAGHDSHEMTSLIFSENTYTKKNKSSCLVQLGLVL